LDLQSINLWFHIWIGHGRQSSKSAYLITVHDFAYRLHIAEMVLDAPKNMNHVYALFNYIFASTAADHAKIEKSRCGC